MENEIQENNLNNLEMKLVPYKIEAIDEIPEFLSYGVDQCQVPLIWDTGEKGEGIVIAIIDTGIDYNHPDLKDQVIGGKNFVDGSDNFFDDNGHGTHVSGLVLSMAPEAKILGCKVLNKDGSGSYQGIIDGIRYATNWTGPNNEKVRVMNLSLGGPDNEPELEKAILEAVSKGILIVCASGNEGDNNEQTMETGYPALYNESICVAACDENKRLAYFSNNSLEVDTIAAGVNVVSAWPGNQYAYLSGTSMATPHISGIFALLIKLGEKEFKRTLTESELFGLLVKICCSIGLVKSSEGYGLPQLSKILEGC
jgi:major intracellular serine protease